MPVELPNCGHPAGGAQWISGSVVGGPAAQWVVMPAAQRACSPSVTALSALSAWVLGGGWERERERERQRERER
jgi:hypothetical protein